MVTNRGSKETGRRSRSLDVENYLRQRIADNQLRPGDRLPTESNLTKAFSVSRSVVREAIATLRAEGHVETRQGAGLFVAEVDPSAVAGADLGNVNLAETTNYVEVLEVRAAVESEAAALAAERCSPACLARIRERHAAFKEVAEAAQLASDEDYDFHLAVAMATNNQQFVKLFEFIVRQTFVPVKLSQGHAKQTMEQAYFEDIVAEHERVLKAISGRKPQAAREAMRAHIHESMRRVQEF